MHAQYQIIPDRRHGMLRVTMAGFFGPDDVRAFVQAVFAGLNQLGTAPNAHLMLCDVRGMKIQTQEIVAAFSGVVGHPALKSRKLAFVTGSSLSRMQTQRLTSRDGVAYFSDLAAAEQWLLAAERAAA